MHVANNGFRNVYLRKCSLQVIWYSSNPRLKQFVFLRPSWLSDVIKQLFRHDVAELDYNMEESFKQNNISPEKFARYVEQIQTDGLVDREFLRGAWAGLVNPESTKSVAEVIVVLLECFELGYPLLRPGSRAVRMSDAIAPPKRQKSRTSAERPSSAASSVEPPTSARPKSSSGGGERSTSRASRPDSAALGSMAGGEATDKKRAGDRNKDGAEMSLPKITKLVVPWLRNGETPKDFLDDYRRYELNAALVALYKYACRVSASFS